MRSHRAATATLFGIAAAVTAAALADPLVELLSNAGLFGPGTFTDHSNANVVPALLAALAAAGALIGVAAWRLLALEDKPLPRCTPGLIAAIFCVQMLVLFGMETSEQIATAGHALGGTIWLGGPVAVSLAIHLTFTAGVALFLKRVLTNAAHRVAQAVRTAFTLYVLRIAQRASFVSRPDGRVLTRFIQPLIALLKGRAPPFCTTAP